MQQHWLRLLSLVGICASITIFAQPAQALETPRQASNLSASASQSVYAYDDVGVIATGSTCPGGVAAIEIHMDDEDKDNANSRGGWIGATISDRNTTFRFCRVSGTLFKALSVLNYPNNHYAVLSLGSVCPGGSVPFSRYFDNEDDTGGNANWSRGDIYPNFSRENTRLYFCLFRSSGDTMSSFPDIGMSYGVFAASGFSKALAEGYVHTDDQDKNNANSYSADITWWNDAQRIITGGNNTDLRMAQVR